MAKDSGNSSIVTWGIIAVGAYFVYEYFFATPTAAAPATSTVGTPGTSEPSQLIPTPNVNPVPAVLPLLPSPPSGGTPPVSTFNSLDQIYTRLKAAAAGDTNFSPTDGSDAMSGSPYHWNFYLDRVWDGTATGTAVPSTPLANVPTLSDMNTPITASQYWAQMAPLLTAQYGLSGLGVFGGLGNFIRNARPGFFPHAVM